MEKIIKIGKNEVRLSNNVSWTMEYRDQFGKDIVPALMPIVASIVETAATVISETGKAEITIKDIAESLQGRTIDVMIPMFQVEFVDVIFNVTWAMAKAANEDILPPKQWAKEFDVFPLDEVAPAIYEMVVKGFMSSKNLKRLKKTIKDLRTLQPSLSTPSSSPGLNED